MENESYQEGSRSVLDIIFADFDTWGPEEWVLFSGEVFILISIVGGLFIAVRNVIDRKK